ncbi:unnamed protein product [Rhizophagus irregularis]|nr:unnamed protein product [Rhizophagus irregularis]
MTSNDAICVNENINSIREWENNHVDGRVCSEPVLLVKPPTKYFHLVAGITAYSTTGDPIQVQTLETRYDDNPSANEYTEQTNNYSFTIKKKIFLII